ncbi:MAG: sigma-70 family RNA polymerase sigma factor [Flavobacteriales bacterium]|nr:sigma-70 family RNA polymerase sigma factor [Flavobacteriales bacterium]
MRLFKTKNIKAFSDAELIAEYKRKGDNEVVGELYKRYSHLVYGVCLKYLKNEDESKDAVLQIFENLMEDLLKHDVTNFKSWLHSVTRNHCLMFLRKQQTILKKEHQYEYEYVSEAVSEISFAPHEKEVKEELLTELEKALNFLKEEQRICIELFFLQEKRYEEVAEITGYSPKQVKSYIQNGKRNLAIHLKSNI